MNLTQQTADSGATMAMKLLPPAAVLGADKLLGLSVPEWVQVLTLIYVALMVLHKLWQMGWGAWKFWVLKQRGGE